MKICLPHTSHTGYSAINKVVLQNNAQILNKNNKSNFGLYPQDIKYKISFGSKLSKEELFALKEYLRNLYYYATSQYAFSRYSDEEVEIIANATTEENKDIAKELSEALTLPPYDSINKTKNYFYQPRFKGQDIVSILATIAKKEKELKTPIREHLKLLVDRTFQYWEHHEYYTDKLLGSDICKILDALNTKNEGALPVLINSCYESKEYSVSGQKPRLKADEVVTILKHVNSKNEGILQELLDLKYDNDLIHNNLPLLSVDAICRILDSQNDGIPESKPASEITVKNDNKTPRRHINALKSLLFEPDDKGGFKLKNLESISGIYSVYSRVSKSKPNIPWMDILITLLDDNRTCEPNYIPNRTDVSGINYCLKAINEENYDMLQTLLDATVMERYGTPKFKKTKRFESLCNVSVCLEYINNKNKGILPWLLNAKDKDGIAIFNNEAVIQLLNKKAEGKIKSKAA